MPTKFDLKKDLKHLYRCPTSDFVEVAVPPITYLAFDGHSDPNTSPAYVAAIESLYTCAYATKFAFRDSTGDDLVVGPLEGLWSAEDPAVFTSGAKDQWDWTMLIPLPRAVTAADITDGLTAAARKKPALPIDQVYTLELHEGPSLQIMHVGSYDDETPTLARLHQQVMPSLCLTFNGRHHEIYLSDPRRVAPEKLKTILRQPVRAA